MIQLLLETATDICSVAVARREECLAESTATDIHQHASHLTLLIEQTLRQAGVGMQEIDQVILSDGPGSYTSLRVGAATVKGLSLPLPQARFSVVSTLTALAAATDATGADRILATINSRKGEVFARMYRATDLQPETEVMNVRLKNPKWRGELLEGRGLGHVTVTGPGSGRIREATVGDNAFTFAAPEQAAARYLVGERVRPFREDRDISAYEPFYLNAPFVTRSKKKSLI